MKNKRAVREEEYFFSQYVADNYKWTDELNCVIKGTVVEIQPAWSITGLPTIFSEKPLTLHPEQLKSLWKPPFLIPDLGNENYKMLDLSLDLYKDKDKNCLIPLFKKFINLRKYFDNEKKLKKEIKEFVSNYGFLGSQISIVFKFPEEKIISGELILSSEEYKIWQEGDYKKGVDENGKPYEKYSFGLDSIEGESLDFWKDEIKQMSTIYDIWIILDELDEIDRRKNLLIDKLREKYEKEVKDTKENIKKVGLYKAYKNSEFFKSLEEDEQIKELKSKKEDKIKELNKYFSFNGNMIFHYPSPREGYFQPPFTTLFMEKDKYYYERWLRIDGGKTFYYPAKRLIIVALKSKLANLSFHPLYNDELLLDKIHPYWIPDNLLTAMWYQFSKLITGSLKTRRCGYCGELIDITDKHSNLKYHTQCKWREKKKRNLTRKKSYNTESVVLK